ncbi:MAG: outer membrane beta-barrel protein [Gemmatimonadota bacterium]
MDRSSLAAVTIALTIALCPTTASAQSSEATLHYGVMGGATIPLKDFATAANVGWNAGALVAFGPSHSPLSFRVDLQWLQLNGKQVAVSQNAYQKTDFRFIDGTVNALYSLPSSARAKVYVIGGAGVYNEHAKERDFNGTWGDTKIGFNGGAGVRFPLGRHAGFIEARYHFIIHGSDIGNVYTLYGTPAHSLQIIPISAGIVF